MTWNKIFAWRAPHWDFGNTISCNVVSLAIVLLRWNNTEEERSIFFQAKDTRNEGAWTNRSILCKLHRRQTTYRISRWNVESTLDASKLTYANSKRNNQTLNRRSKPKLGYLESSKAKKITRKLPFVYRNKYIIFSKSVATALKKLESNDTIIQSIIGINSKLARTNREVLFSWIPAHAGIERKWRIWIFRKSWTLQWSTIISKSIFINVANYGTKNVRPSAKFATVCDKLVS